MVLPMQIRSVSLGVVFAAAVITGAWAGQHEQRPVVVELFTSQGCSDCPAADRLVTELAKRKDVIALSLPITYWDMLGWKDTYATDANTQRQKSYARAMNRSGAALIHSTRKSLYVRTISRRKPSSSMSA